MAYTREEKAEALALMRTGVSAQRAAKELGLQPRTVQIWAKRFREISPEEMPKSIRDEDLKIVQRAQDLIHEAFDEIEETGDARKYLIPLNAVKGYGTRQGLPDAWFPTVNTHHHYVQRKVH